MNVRLVAAEWLKLRKRRGLFWWSLALTIGVVTVVFGILQVLHVANPSHNDPAGGVSGFQGALMGLTAAGAIAAIMMGAVAGTADVSSGVFRDLVATGRSRWQLFAARVPGALALFLPMITLGFIVVAGCSVAFAGSMPIPGPSLIARGYGWVVLYTGFDLVVAIGFSSLIGSRGTTIGVLLGWQFIASPLLAQVSFLGQARQALFTAALDRLNPVLATDGGQTVVRSAAMAGVVLASWLCVTLAAGGWRTATRDA